MNLKSYLKKQKANIYFIFNYVHVCVCEYVLITSVPRP